jgi:succinylglutamate desuccinylase
MQYSIETIGKEKPRIAIIGCVHGDEILGKKVIQELKKIKINKGSITFIIANNPALLKRKRFIRKDLNRVFPGKKNGITEEKIAYFLNKELKKIDIVIDIHATSSEFNKLAVITNFNLKTKELLKLIPINKVALVRKNVFGGNELIAHSKLGIALEYGQGKGIKHYKRVLQDVRIVLKNLNLINGKKKIFNQKTIYNVLRPYTVAENFKQNSNLRDFCLIKKKQVIGRIGHQEIKSIERFYPLFLGKGKYKKTLALVSSKNNINLN